MMTVRAKHTAKYTTVDRIAIEAWTNIFYQSFFRNQISRIIQLIVSALIMFLLVLDASGMEAV